MNSNSTDKKQIRKFGLIAFIFFGILCALGIWKDKLLPTYLFGFLSVLGLGFIVAPIHLKPAFYAWQRLARLIGRVITNIVLILIYYLVITPSGLIKRLFGGKPLPTKPDKNISSYWVTRPEPAQPSERFLKRY
ncbi:MAG: hypothetical protein PVH74_14940 [Desulfobacterales bacterium]|jgi:hypothetical protein